MLSVASGHGLSFLSVVFGNSRKERASLAGLWIFEKTEKNAREVVEMMKSRKCIQAFPTQWERIFPKLGHLPQFAFSCSGSVPTVSRSCFGSFGPRVMKSGCQ